MAQQWFHLARPDGFDFYTGKTINYREAVGSTVRPPQTIEQPSLCGPGVLHASLTPAQCFIGASIPCSVFVVEGTPIIPFDGEKAGFAELYIVQELKPQDVFKWRYDEAVHPLNPFSLPKASPTHSDIDLLREWASMRTIVKDSVWESVKAIVWKGEWGSVRDSMWDNIVRDIVWDGIVGDNSVWGGVKEGSVWDSGMASVWAYIGYLFAPVVADWKLVKHHTIAYPFMASVELWQRGLVHSYDGSVWRLQSGEKAEIVWKGLV